MDYTGDRGRVGTEISGVRTFEICFTETGEESIVSFK